MTGVTINLTIARAYVERGGRAALPLAILAVSDALAFANRANDNAAKGTCLRILNWLRSDARQEGAVRS